MTPIFLLIILLSFSLLFATLDLCGFVAFFPTNLEQQVVSAFVDTHPYDYLSYLLTNAWVKNCLPLDPRISAGCDQCPDFILQIGRSELGWQFGKVRVSLVLGLESQSAYGGRGESRDLGWQGNSCCHQGRERVRKHHGSHRARGNGRIRNHCIHRQ
jgi:hypothetical protein